MRSLAHLRELNSLTIAEKETNRCKATKEIIIMPVRLTFFAVQARPHDTLSVCVCVRRATRWNLTQYQFLSQKKAKTVSCFANRMNEGTNELKRKKKIVASGECADNRRKTTKM